MPEGAVTLNRRGSLALIRLNQPQSLNLVTVDMAWELRQVCRRLNEDGQTRVAILTGAGSVFSCGRDRFDDLNGLPLSQWLELHRVASALAGLKMPTIAAINGNALDHGLELALACDLRTVAEDARLGFTDLSQGMIPRDGGTQRLARVVGRSQALELFLTGRLVTATEALSMGLVCMVAPQNGALIAAEELASGIASTAPIAAQYTKEAIHKGMDLSLQQGLELEADLSFILQSTRDRLEGVRSFLEKREPQFKGE